MSKRWTKLSVSYNNIEYQKYSKKVLLLIFSKSLKIRIIRYY